MLLVREYLVPVRPPPPPYLPPPTPGSLKGAACCIVITALALLALGINTIKTAKSDELIIAEGAIFIAVAGCCLLSLVAIAIHQCLKTRRQRAPVTTDYSEMPD